MSLKKIVIILIAVLIGTLAFNLYYSKSKAVKAKKIAEQAMIAVNTVSVPADRLEDIKKNKEAADKLFKKWQYKKSKEQYNSISGVANTLIQEKLDKTINELSSYGHDIKELQKMKNEGSELLKEKDYLNSIAKYKEAIKQALSLKEKYIKQAQEEKPALESNISKEKTLISLELNKDYKVKSVVILVNGEWAVATVTPLSFETDDANMALKKEDDRWTVTAGPGTYFTKEDFPDIPEAVINKLNDN